VIAVADSSPLILLSKTGYLNLLLSLAAQVVVPEAVYHEITSGGDRVGASDLERAGWITVCPVENRGRVARLPTTLHLGEAEAIVLALEISEPVVVLLDDRAARREARRHGLTVRGTAGLILQAKEAGLIPAVHLVLMELREAGLYLSEGLYERLLAAANESPIP